MKIEGYCGICACCFEPIENGELFRFRENGRNFHKNCVEEYPNDYYVKMERRHSKIKKTAENSNSQTVKTK